MSVVVMNQRIGLNVVSSQPNLPSVGRMAVNVAKSITRNVSQAVSGKAVVVPEEIKLIRISTCEACPKYRKSDSRCSLCGCYIQGKVFDKAKWAAEFCPEPPPRWEAFLVIPPKIVDATE